jgi:hypothetical protein
MKTPNNIDKAIPGRGNNEATKEILLAVDKEKLEFDAMNDILDTLMEEFKKEAKPDTPFRSQMSKGGEHPLTKIVRQLFEEQEYPFREKQIIIGSTELYNILRSKGMLRNGRINDVAMALEQIGGRSLGQCRVSIDKKITKPTLYLIRELDKHFGKKPQELVDELYFPVVPEDLEKGGII